MCRGKRRMTVADISPQSAPELSFEPYSASIGCGIGGVDLREPLSDAHCAAIRQALLDWKVVFFRDQTLSVEQHLAFARKFGELEVHPFTNNDPTHPEVIHIHHTEESPGEENGWHSDVTWRLEPSLGSVLRCIEGPALGGDTLFCDMHAAYEGLPEEVKDQIDGKLAVHDFEGFRKGLRRRGVDEAVIQRHLSDYPNPEHPVVRTHPETGRQAIYVNAGFTRHIVGMDHDESDSLLQRLYAQTATPEYQCRFRWKRNSIAFWDNRACQHYAASDYWPNRRIMDRVTIVGDKPFYEPGREVGAWEAMPFRGQINRRRQGLWYF